MALRRRLTQDQAIPTISDSMHSAGTRQKITVDQSLPNNLTVPASARCAMLQNQGPGRIRWTDDGATNPSATEGFILDVLDTLWFVGDLDNFNCYDETAASPVLYVAYYKGGTS